MQPRHIALALTFWATTSGADNIGLPDGAVPVGSITNAQVGCTTTLFEDNVLEAEPAAGQFDARFALNIAGDPSTRFFRARTQLKMRVHHTSGEVSGSRPLVSVDWGNFSVYAASESLDDVPFVGGTVLRSNIVGAISPNEGGQQAFVANVTYLSPEIEALVGPVSTIEIRRGVNPWGPEGFWQEDAAASDQDCFLATPDIDLFAEPLPGPSPLTFEIDLSVVPPDDVGACPYDIGNPFPGKAIVTWDANAQDLDPDPNVGRYLSCTDEYGSSSGVVLEIAGSSTRNSCVLVVVENDVPGGQNGFVDRISIELIGDEAVTGTLVSADNDDFNVFTDDSLPQAPLAFGFDEDFIDASFDVTFAGPDACQFAVRATGMTAIGDADVDGVADRLDNCPNDFNARQRDSDGDGFGNACDADLNNDMVVNVIDLGLMRQAFFGLGNANADLNSDGVVNIVDLGILRQRFFLPPG